MEKINHNPPMVFDMDEEWDKKKIWSETLLNYIQYFAHLKDQFAKIHEELNYVVEVLPYTVLKHEDFNVLFRKTTGMGIRIKPKTSLTLELNEHKQLYLIKLLQNKLMPTISDLTINYVSYSSEKYMENFVKISMPKSLKVLRFNLGNSPTISFPNYILKWAHKVVNSIDLGNMNLSTEEFKSILHEFCHWNSVGIINSNILVENEFTIEEMPNWKISWLNFTETFEDCAFSDFLKIIKAVAKCSSLIFNIKRIFIGYKVVSMLGENNADFEALGISKGIFKI